MHCDVGTCNAFSSALSATSAISVLAISWYLVLITTKWLRFSSTIASSTWENQASERAREREWEREREREREKERKSGREEEKDIERKRSSDTWKGSRVSPTAEMECPYSLLLFFLDTNAGACLVAAFGVRWWNNI